MINAFKLRKLAALLICGFACTIAYVMGNMYYGLWGGVGFFFAGLLVTVLLGNLLLSNPFTKMIEGKGILAINIDSTGVLRPFIVSVRPPYIEGKLFGKTIKDIFNRQTVMGIAAPQENKQPSIFDNEGGITIKLDEEKLNAGRFALWHYPVLLYNQQIGSVITKDFLSEQEKDTFAEHNVIYLNKKVEELTSVVRDFARHVVETLKPQSSFMQSAWLKWIIIGLIVILGILFAPALIDAFKGISGEMGGLLG